MATLSPFADPGPVEVDGGTSGEESLIILQSLICLMREKNLLTRADVEELCQKVERRAAGESRNPMPCCPTSATRASGLMRRMTSYLGQRYGGKHGRWVAN